jgi:hypothetical protein
LPKSAQLRFNDTLVASYERRLINIEKDERSIKLYFVFSRLKRPINSFAVSDLRRQVGGRGVPFIV